VVVRLSFFSYIAKDCGMTWTTNHKKTAVHGLVSRPITAYVSHISWQLSMATLLPASADHVVPTNCFYSWYLCFWFLLTFSYLFGHICRLPSFPTITSVHWRLHRHTSCHWLEASTGPSMENLEDGRRYGSTHQCLSICNPGPLVVEIATTLSRSSAAVSEWVSIWYVELIGITE